MFNYKLPDGGLRAHCYFNSNGDIKFDPPVYEQRYTTTVRILEDPHWGYKFKKVRPVFYSSSICIQEISISLFESISFNAGGRFWMC